jgi:hypothetical protein
MRILRGFLARLAYPPVTLVRDAPYLGFESLNTWVVVHTPCFNWMPFFICQSAPAMRRESPCSLSSEQSSDS